MFALLLAGDVSGWRRPHGWRMVVGHGHRVALFLAFIGFLVYLLVRHHTDSGTSTGQRSTAEDMLAERLARGEIDEDEYRRRRDALRGETIS